MSLVSLVFPDPASRLVCRHPDDRFSKKGGRLVAAKRGPQEPRCLGPVAGKRPLFFASGPENSARQATAVWTWSNFLHDQMPSGLTPLRVNFDETGIRYFQDTRQGHLTEGAERQRRTPRSLTRLATKGETRAMMSLATFVCDDAAVQAVLPQVLLVNKSLLTQEEMAAAMVGMPAQMQIWREDKAWTTGDIMIRLLRALRAALDPVLSERKVILSADAFRAHLTKPVFRAAADLGFFYHLIPSKMTWALQPLDTHVFAVFKRYLSERAQSLLASSESNKLTRPQLIAAVSYAVDVVLCRRCWKGAFQDCGLTGAQDTVSPRTLGKLGAVSPPPSGRGLPSLEMLMDIFPARATIPIDDVFRAFLPASRARASEPTAIAPLADSTLDEVRDPRAPWTSRLRSSSALRLGSQDTAPHAESCRPPAPMTPAATTAMARAADALPMARRRVAVGHRLGPRLTPSASTRSPGTPPPQAPAASSSTPSSVSRSSRGT